MYKKSLARTKLRMLACDVPTYLCAVLQIDGWSVHFNDVVEPVNSSPVSHHHVCYPWQQPVRENDVRGGSARRLACPPQRGRGHIASPRGEAGAGERRPRAKRAHCLPNEAQRRQLGGAGVGFSVSRGEVKLEGAMPLAGAVSLAERARYPWRCRPGAENFKKGAPGAATVSHCPLIQPPLHPVPRSRGLKILFFLF